MSESRTVYAVRQTDPSIIASDEDIQKVAHAVVMGLTSLIAGDLIAIALTGSEDAKDFVGLLSNILLNIDNG